MHALDFLRQFFRKPRDTGALWPTGRELAESLTDLADLGSADLIVELGPGTGPFTARILKKKSPDAGFFAIEKNGEFCRLLRAEFPGLAVHEAGAEKIGDLLAAAGCRQCDRVVSGLPWAAFASADQEKILSAVLGALAPGGIFVTFTYVHSPFLASGRAFRRRLEASFRSVELSPVAWKNFPPAFVYRCSK